MARSFRAGYCWGWSGNWGLAASGGRGALTFRNGRETFRERHANRTANMIDAVEKVGGEMGVLD